MGLGVDVEHRADGQAEQQSEAEQQADRQLLVPARGGDIQAEDAGEGADEQQQPGAAAEVAPDVGAQRGAADGQGDQAHDLAEDVAGAVAGDRRAAESKFVVCGHPQVLLVCSIVVPDWAETVDDDLGI